ncbi:MAG: low molecular weight phosphotyrosine protein phosphatase, partial [Gammaproteobacteria bacterium]|nr:low molecular weight phosphotyrosine protein phosphatase [Gammaproteobacteria bacterium]MCW8957939.1 low molecular weight phosphotyrosine protein phosphatase [Gammaproteobacteria bacterium]
MGNICRSPLAHGLFQGLVEKAGLSDSIWVDSAGTHAYHVGETPDPRSQQTALRHGIDLSMQRARRVADEDFERFDYILAMDRDNFTILQRSAPVQHRHKLRMFLEFAPQMNEEEVPDPYYGGANGFDRVYDLVEAAAAGLLEEIRNRHL